MTAGVPEFLQHQYPADSQNCPRCSRLIRDIVQEHLDVCPAPHTFQPSGKLECGFNLVPLCEGEIEKAGLEHMYDRRN